MHTTATGLRSALPRLLWTLVFTSWCGILLRTTPTVQGFSPPASSTKILTTANPSFMMAPTRQLGSTGPRRVTDGRKSRLALRNANGCYTTSSLHEDDDDDSSSSSAIVPRMRTMARRLTGWSASAIYASTVAATGAWIRQTMRWILQLFPPSFRYFVQPFLVLYYVPLTLLRYWTQRPRTREADHDVWVEQWKSAVQRADDKLSYWPVHVNGSGEFQSDISELDWNEAIAESVEVSYEEDSSDTDNSSSESSTPRSYHP